MKAKTFSKFDIHINKAFRADSRTCPLARNATLQLQGTLSLICKTSSTSLQMDEAHCVTFKIRSCSDSAFVWLQVAGNLTGWSLKHFSVYKINCQSRRDYTRKAYFAFTFSG